jgi:DNA-binding MarR family transcriptional regulator
MSRLASPRKSRGRFDSLEQETFLSLWRTYDRLRAIEEQVLGEFDLTPQQYNVLRLLQAADGELLPTLRLVERLISRAPDVTRMLDKLEVRGLISRERPPDNRRTVLVGITPAGKKLLDTIAEPLRDCHLRQLGHVSADEMRQMIELLRKARDPHETEQSPWR